jgi:hypothetical protein
MKKNVAGAKPIRGSKYLNASNEIRPYMIRFGVSFAGKNGSLRRSCLSLFKNEQINMDPERAIRRTEASKGKRPAPGKRKDPNGYWRDFKQMINPNKNRPIPLILSEFFIIPVMDAHIQSEQGSFSTINPSLFGHDSS